MKNLGVICFYLGICLLLVACRQADSPSMADNSAIYAAVIRQMITIDDTFGGTLHPAQIYVLTTTNDQAGDPNTSAADSQPLAPELQDSVTAELSDLAATLTWVESREDVPVDADTGQIAGNGVLVTLGNVHPQEDGTVHVPASIYIANLAAGGQIYVLEQVESVWMITGTTGVRWIS